LAVGGVDGRLGGEDDLSHELDQGAEGQLLGVLGGSHPIEEGIEGAVGESVRQHGADHHRHRRLVEESLQDVVHEQPSLKKRSSRVAKT
jgi:hypothetical protein